MQRKARNWIRRELQALQTSENGEGGVRHGSHGSFNPEFLLEYTVAILRNVDLRDNSGKAPDLLRDYLGPDTARLFVHELESWMRSPYTRLDDWDQIVQYKKALPAICEQGCRQLRP